MGQHSHFGRAVATALRTARRQTTPSNTQSASGITYARPSTGDSVAIADVGIGRLARDFEIDDELIVATDKLADFLVDVDDLDFGDGRIKPAEGDVITFIVQHDDGDPHADEGDALIQTLKYLVAPAVIGEPAWRYVDPSRSTYRIHAQLVNETATEISW